MISFSEKEIVFMEKMKKKYYRALTIAGSDSGSGAGIQADLKTFTVLGVYGMSIITALTSQNTIGVQGIHNVPTQFVSLQLDSVLSDIGADAVKTGMLSNKNIIGVVAEKIKDYNIKKLVVDPVMISKHGSKLLQDSAIDTLIKKLIPLSMIITPNKNEAEIISHITIRNISDMKKSAQIIYKLGAQYVFIKGGHIKGDADDLIFDGKNFILLKNERIKIRHTHGTGCTLSAAITAYLAMNYPPVEAIKSGKKFVTQTIKYAFKLGQGIGPVNHIYKFYK